MSEVKTVITGTGSYVPPVIKRNQDFTEQEFYTETSELIILPGHETLKKFQDITGIEERRYAENDMNASDMATLAAKAALDDSGIDPEELDQIILAQNFGNVLSYSIQSDMLPALASRVKHDLGIENPACIAYDIVFGCPGWLQGLTYKLIVFSKQALPKKR